MIISIALLGFGASGTVLALAQRRLLALHHTFAGCTAVAITAISSVAAAIRLPFNPLAIVWEARN
jgi:hypothetical protein